MFPVHRALACLLGLFLLGGRDEALADQVKVYEWKGPDGTVSYALTPPPGAPADVNARQIEFKRLTPAERQAAATRLQRIGAAGEAEARRYRQELKTADRAIDQASLRLSTAETAARRGREPLPGDRVGNSGGGSRMRSGYFERQRQLEAAVQQHRQELDAAYANLETIEP